MTALAVRGGVCIMEDLRKRVAELKGKAEVADVFGSTPAKSGSWGCCDDPGN
jgi:hypothetical protein